MVMAWVFSAVFTNLGLNATGSWQSDIDPLWAESSTEWTLEAPSNLESVSACGSSSVVAHVTGEAQGGGVLNY